MDDAEYLVNALWIRQNILYVNAEIAPVDETEYLVNADLAPMDEAEYLVNVDLVLCMRQNTLSM